MKVINASIVKTNTTQEAFLKALPEMFNSKYVEQYSDVLITEGLGIHVGIPESTSTCYSVCTSYFFITPLAKGFFRVEYCSKSEMHYPELEK